jgi:hypothetical protein
MALFNNSPIGQLLCGNGLLSMSVHGNLLMIKALMKQVQYPFWLITQKQDGGLQPLVIQECPEYILAFTSVQKAKDYMLAKGIGAWELQMVSRSTFRPLIERYRQLGLHGLCFDPDENTSGDQVDFDS